MILRAGNDPRLLVRRQPHCLRLVELRILKGGQPEQPVLKRGNQSLFGDIDLVPENHLQRVRQAGDGRLSSLTRGWGRPRLVRIFISGRKPHAHDLPAPLSIAHDRFDSRTADRAYCRQERPLIGIRNEPVIDEDAVAVLARLLLQGKRDQIAEASPRKRVLVRKEAVVRIETDFGAAFHRLGQDVRTEPPRERGRDGLFEEEPHVTALAGARALDGGGKIQLTARLRERRRILPPASLVEIRRQEEARLVEEHRIHPGHERLARVVVSR
jgi:hypothetical protein